MIDKDKHVYCSCCMHGKALLEEIESEGDTVVPSACKGCFPWDPEDSKRFAERPNYVQSTDENVENWLDKMHNL